MINGENMRKSYFEPRCELYDIESDQILALSGSDEQSVEIVNEEEDDIVGDVNKGSVFDLW